MHYNPLSLIDFYKADHRRQYPAGTELVFSNFTARKSRHPNINKVVFFGLRYFIEEYLQHQWQVNFFGQPLEAVLKDYQQILDSGLGAQHGITLEHIEKLHALRYLPINIYALPEGTRVPCGIPMLVMWNTHPDFFWLTNYLETVLSATLWQACTTATLAREIRKEFIKGAYASGKTDVDTLFQGHDFSFRGMSSVETACLSGAAHLLSFLGTDTVPALEWINKYYYHNTEWLGGSVPATEHSVMCMGEETTELETFDRILDLYPRGIVSIVSDTWNYWRVLTEILPKLKDKIMAREGKVVIRPDSSITTPADNIAGNTFSPYIPEYKGSVELLWDIFGGHINAAGFKELDDNIGLIYGDSITLEMVQAVNERLLRKGFATTNWVGGIGSYSYQYNTRDTFGFAMKATYGVVNSVGREIYKCPVTDNGTKHSARGMLAVYRSHDDNQLYLQQNARLEEVESCEFVPYLINGAVYAVENFDTIRRRVQEGLYDAD